MIDCVDCGKQIGSKKEPMYVVCGECFHKRTGFAADPAIGEFDPEEAANCDHRGTMVVKSMDFEDVSFVDGNATFSITVECSRCGKTASGIIGADDEDFYTPA